MTAAPPDAELVADLVALHALLPSQTAGDGRHTAPLVLSNRRDVLVVRLGDTVLKVHAADTDLGALDARLRVAADPRLREILLAPLAIPPTTTVGATTVAATTVAATTVGAAVRVRGRLVTAWPAGTPLRPEEVDEAPWEQAATLLARLHTVDVPEVLPPAGGARRVRRAVARLRAAADDVPADPGAVDAVLRAYATLPDPLRATADPGARSGLIHGDWHLGQLVRSGDGWLLIDVDDLGSGDPAWDLARPAAWYAAGLLAPSVWHRFLAAYLDAGGWAVPADSDPWPALEVPAQALAVQTAAQALVQAGEEGGPLDEVAKAFVACCQRIAELGGRPGLPPVSGAFDGYDLEREPGPSVSEVPRRDADVQPQWNPHRAV